MKLVQINMSCGSGSTGKICIAVSRLLTEKGIENYIMYSLGNSDYSLGRRYMERREVKLQALRSRILGNYGFNSKKATGRLIAMLDEIGPDVVHLHNLHAHNCQLETLFTYFKEKNVKIYWTFHDCWAFTGYCPHYDMIGCDRWKTGGCQNCPQKGRYSWFFDKSRELFEKKKELFTGLPMTVITPSHWMAEQVKQSFLNIHDVKVIHNGINLEIFRPRESDFRRRYGIGEDRYVILGVSFGWGERKGLDVFVELSKRLDDRFQLVLIGTDDDTDRQLPSNVISIHRTQNQIELAEIYTAADLLVNPTREENYPTVHMEALACGTPVLSFATGGCAEMLDDTCGMTVPKNDVVAMEHAAVAICQGKLYSSEACVLKAREFCESARFKEYVALYGVGKD